MWQNDVKLALGQALLLLERVEQKLDSNQSYTLNERSVNSYAAGWNGRWGSNNFQFNLRQDRNSQYGNKNSEFIGYGYQFTTSWNMAASYGTAFKAPTFNDLFYPVTPGVGGGNANLKPEDATNREVSLRYDTDKVQGHLTYFDNKIKNLIQWADDGTGAWYPTNLASASIKGEELCFCSSACMEIQGGPHVARSQRRFKRIATGVACKAICNARQCLLAG